MAQIEKYFDGISEAIDAIADCLDEGALSRKDADQIQDILAEIKPTLPAFEYALKLYNQEPKLVIDKRELAFACGELCEKVMRINAISSFGKWDTDGAFIRKALRFHYGDSVLTLDTTARTPETLSLRPSQVVLLTKRQPRKAATFRFTTRRSP